MNNTTAVLPTSIGAARATAGRLKRKLLRRDVINRGGKGVVNVVDVGSVDGLSAKWRNHGPLVRHLLNFEPLEEASTNGTVRTVPAALWHSSESRPFYIQNGSQQGNSLYPPNHEYVREHYNEIATRGRPELAATWHERSAVARTIMLDTTTLDAVLQSLNDEVKYDFLKIDVQGADLDVVKGADQFVREDCLAIQLEAFLLPLYKGIALLPEIDEYLDARGFYRALTEPAHGTFDSQHDVLYVRRDAPSSAALDAVRKVYGLSAA